MSDLETQPVSGKKLSYHEYTRCLVARANVDGALPFAELAPEIREAVAQTLAVVRWLDELNGDGIMNYRGGSLEKTDVPMPLPPEGELTPYILNYLGLID